MTLPRSAALVASLLAMILSACTLQPALPETAAKISTSAFEQDRKAILAMAGDYRVDFAFDETVVLAPGYERHPAHRSSGHEFVAVLEDSGTRLSLQHVLVSDSGHVTKHWRQDWEYQQTRSWQYVGDNVWQRRDLSLAAVEGQWTQTVWQVDDSPRYAGIGRWTHDEGVASWTSEPEWRPLPRREHTTRSDYDKLLGSNRQTITPTGWVHEQDNLKINRKAAGGEQALVREVGLNTYTKVSDYDFSAGHAYWARTQDYWAAVRSAWRDLFAARARVQLREKSTNDELLFEALFEQADALGGKGKTTVELRAAIDSTLLRFVAPDTQAGTSDALIAAREIPVSRSSSQP